MDSDYQFVVETPPYPPQSANGNGLYLHLTALRAWAAVEREHLVPLLPTVRSAQLTALPTLETVTIWEHVSVYDKYQVWQWLRHLREGWDAIIRDHEDGWTCRLSVRRRYGALRLAYWLLGQAFVSPEVREMWAAEAAEKRQKRNHYANQVLTPPEFRAQQGRRPGASSFPDEDDADVPTDVWFDGVTGAAAVEDDDNEGST